MTETEKYVRKHLQKELAEVQSSAIAKVQNGLDIYEKVLIYFYTGEGYQSINNEIRNSKKNNLSKIGSLLNKALDKLPSYTGLVHRTANLTNKEIVIYRKSLLGNIPITESTFVSTSKSPAIARLYPMWNVRFRIISKNGKNIEEISQMGVNNPPNEQEILFGAGHSFQVLNVTEDSAKC